MVDQTALPPRREDGQKGALKPLPVPVADRIRAIEEKTPAPPLPRRPTVLQRTYATKSALPSKEDSNLKGNTPMVFPLHVRRFVRRTSNATPFRPETPLYRARHDDERTIHSPQALRAMPIPEPPPSRALPSSDTPNTIYKTPPEILDTTRGDHDSSIARNVGYGRRQSKNFAMRPTSRPGERGRPCISPASFLHGTRENCVRHRRRPASTLQAASDRKVTKDMFEQSGRTGAYMPTGLPARRQMEATSPWKKGPTEACPDCITELNIKRRDASRAIEKDGSTSTVHRPSDNRSLEATSWLGEIAEDDLHSTGVPAAWTPRIIPRDAAGHQMNHAKQMITGGDEHALVITHSLGDHLNAAIFECGGELERVVLNNRLSMPPADVLQKLSRNLLSVSNFLSSKAAGTQPTVHHGPGDRAVVLDMRQDKNPASLSELMELIDDAVKGMDHEKNHEQREHWPSDPQDFANDVSRRIGRQSLVYSDEVDNVLGGNGISPASRLVHRQTFHDYEQLQKQCGQAPTPIHREVLPAQRSWWWPLGRQRSRDPSPRPSPGAIPIITTTQPSQRPSLSHTGGPHAPPLVLMPTYPPANPSSNLLPTALTSKSFAIPPLAMPPKRDVSGSSVHPSISEILSPNALTPGSSASNEIPSNREDSTSRDKSGGPPETTPAISHAANPYHHAPSTPRDLNSADWAAKGHRRDSNHVRNAMRMDKSRTGRNGANG